MTDEHQGVVAARQDYQACLAEHGNSREACGALEERYRTAVRQYEQSSRRAWGCDPKQEECPTPR